MFVKGKEKTGGRKKGVQNKVNTLARAWISDLLTTERAEFENKLRTLPAVKYCEIYVALLGYVTPKQQSVSIDTQIEAEYKHLRLLLQDSPREAVEAITKRIVTLQKENEV